MITYIWAKLLKKIRGSAIKNSSIHKTSKVESGSNILNVIMDKYSFCGYNCEIVNCKIGSFTSIANNVIIGGYMHPMNWVSTSSVFYGGRDSIKAKFASHKLIHQKQTIIEHDVWIGQNAMIKQGVNIGTGAVIGMGSIVTKDVAPYSIVAGNPAKEIRKRFEQNIIERLIDSKWWEYDDYKLRKEAVNFNSVNIFLKNLIKSKNDER